MKRLVFDLRDNPGGPLDQAIRISNRFLPRGDMIVYTRGRVPNADQDYRATEQSDYTHLPMVVLVNRNSASASEIVTGALQDHDRALVVGETTFGKALVQSVYPISEGAGLALTTGRYYTPSGALIQRPWDGTFDEYLTYTLRDQTERASALGGGAEVHRRRPQGLQRRRHRARQVLRRARCEGFNPTRFGRSLVARAGFANFADQFTAEGDTRLSAANKNKKKIARGFVVTDAMVADFKALIADAEDQDRRGGFAKDETFIRAMIHYDIDVALFGIDEARRNLIAKDPQAQFALSQFGEAVNLLELAAATAARAAKGGKAVSAVGHLALYFAVAL